MSARSWAPWLLCALASGCERDRGALPPKETATTPSTSPSSTSPSTSATTPPTSTPEPPQRPLLASPPDAPDLDPDPSILHVALTAAPLAYEIDGVRIEGMAYEGRVPGPTLRARVGDTVVVDFVNALPDPTTIHWHGLDVPIEMDGAGWPMPMVSPGGTFQYRFVVEQTGTFWYHPHLDTAHQVDRGLYGAFVVEDPADPIPDLELIAVLDTFGEPEAAEADPHVVDATLADWAVNGSLDPLLELPAGAVVRARLVNASNAGYVELPARPDQRVVAHDQGLLSEPEEGVILAPGDRAEIEWQIGSDTDIERLPYTVAGGPVPDAPIRLFEIRTSGAVPPSGGLPWAFDGAPPTPDPGATDIRLLLSGSPELGWEINGATFPDVEVPRVALGQTVVIEVRNASPALHPFHLHGHTFEVLSIDGVPPLHQRVEDTVDVPILGTVRLLVHADNPGTWMMHCHVLPHAEGGMMTLLEVVP